MPKEIIIVTIILETITILGRLFFGSMRVFHKKNKLPVRIHHGYIGLLLIIIYYSITPYPMLLLIGGSLFFSDLIHHFAVLPIWVKTTEFP